MPWSVYYDIATGEIQGASHLAVVDSPSAPTDQAKVEVSDTNFDDENIRTHHCPGGVYTRRDYLALSTDQVDSVTPYDGVPDCAADGSAAHTITIQAKNGADDSDNTDRTDTLYMEVMNGACKLSDISADLVNGALTFTATSTFTGKCILRVYDPAVVIVQQTIEIQFTT